MTDDGLYGWRISCFSKCTPGLARECFEAYDSVPAFPSDPYNMRQTMTDPFRVPLIIRGEIIDDGEIDHGGRRGGVSRSEEHTSELQPLMRISYAVFCLKNKKKDKKY